MGRDPDPAEHLGERMLGRFRAPREYWTTLGLCEGAGRTMRPAAPSSARRVPRRGRARQRGVTGWCGTSLPGPYSQPPAALSAPGARKPGWSEGRWTPPCPIRPRAVGDGLAEATTLSPLPPPASSRPHPLWPVAPLQHSPGLHCISVPQFPYCNSGPVSGGRRRQDGARGMLVVLTEMVSGAEPRGRGGERGRRAKAA